MDCPDLRMDPDGQSYVCILWRHRVYLPVDVTREKDRHKQDIQENMPMVAVYVYVTCSGCGKAMRVDRHHQALKRWCRTCRSKKQDEAAIRSTAKRREEASARLMKRKREAEASLE